MVFGYFHNLSKAGQAIYRNSDRITSIRLPDVRPLRLASQSLQTALLDENQRAVGMACRDLLRGVTGQLVITPVEVQVLAVRPHDEEGELHGLYNPAEAGRPARIRVWMRTAKRRRVVAFKSFLRTLLHELCHHIDYEYLQLADSFHTEGFYRRESSLFHQLCHDAVPLKRQVNQSAGGDQ